MILKRTLRQIEENSLEEIGEQEKYPDTGHRESQLTTGRRLPWRWQGERPPAQGPSPDSSVMLNQLFSTCCIHGKALQLCAKDKSKNTTVFHCVPVHTYRVLSCGPNRYTTINKLPHWKHINSEIAWGTAFDSEWSCRDMRAPSCFTSPCCMEK